MPLLPGFDEMYKAYVKSALHYESDDEGRPLDRTYTVRSFTKEALDKMGRDCAVFLYNNARFIHDQYAEAGRDFWLTRNHHGRGFWEDHWSDREGKALTKAAHEFGEQNVYAAGLKLHVFPS